jgi:hypothetical protein
MNLVSVPCNCNLRCIIPQAKFIYKQAKNYEKQKDFFFFSGDKPKTVPALATKVHRFSTPNVHITNVYKYNKFVFFHCF